MWIGSLIVKFFTRRFFGIFCAEPIRPFYQAFPVDLGPTLQLVLWADVLQFEDADWQKALADFSNMDVEVPATVTVEGRELRHVGVSFRGASSYFTVPAGRKRSLKVSVDDVHEDQRLLGARSLNLLNAHVDPSNLRSVL
jgi:hypothetical protein